MRKKVLVLGLASVFMLVGVAGMTADLGVEDAAICKDVEERACVEPGKSFPADVGKLYCFTRITGAEDGATVTHVWSLNDEEIASVNLKVGSKNWRTYSSKNIWKAWRGNCKVEVKDLDGNVLETLEFKLVDPEKKKKPKMKEEEQEEEEEGMD